MQTEIPIPQQPPETSKFKRGETAYILNGKRSTGVPAIIVEHYSWKNAYRIECSLFDIVAESDLLSRAELDAELKRRKDLADATKDQNDRSRLAEVIQLWHAGMRDAVTMAGMAGGPVVKWHQKIASAKRLGFIQ